MIEAIARKEMNGTDWKRPGTLTEEEIMQNALDDPGCPPLSDEDMKRLFPGRLLPISSRAQSLVFAGRLDKLASA